MAEHLQHHKYARGACLRLSAALAAVWWVASASGCRNSDAEGAAGADAPEIDARERGTDQGGGATHRSMPAEIRRLLADGDGIAVVGLHLSHRPLATPWAYIADGRVAVYANGTRTEFATGASTGLILDEFRSEFGDDTTDGCIALGRQGAVDVAVGGVYASSRAWCLEARQVLATVCDSPERWPPSLASLGELDVEGASLCTRLADAESSHRTSSCESVRSVPCPTARPEPISCAPVEPAWLDALSDRLSPPLDDAVLTYRYIGHLDGTQRPLRTVVRTCSLGADGAVLCRDDTSGDLTQRPPSDTSLHAALHATRFADSLSGSDIACGEAAHGAGAGALLTVQGRRVAVPLGRVSGLGWLSPCSDSWVGAAFEAFDVCWDEMERASNAE